jgi:hypothetical protein
MPTTRPATINIVQYFFGDLALQHQVIHASQAKQKKISAQCLQSCLGRGLAGASGVSHLRLQRRAISWSQMALHDIIRAHFVDLLCLFGRKLEDVPLLRLVPSASFHFQVVTFGI